MADKSNWLVGQRVRAEYRRWLFLRRGLNQQLTVPTILDQIPGDADGLMHINKINAPLRVSIPLWPDRPPISGMSNALYLDWRPATPGAEFEQFAREDVPSIVELPDSDFPLQREIPLNVFDHFEGKFEFRYRVENWNAPTITDSVAAPVTIDRTGPVRPGIPQALISTDGDLITTASLDSHGGIRCEIPDFTEDKKESVIVAVALMDEIPDPLPAPGELAFLGVLPTDRIILIPKDKVIALGSKEQYIAYVLFDKAGNRSDLPLPTKVQVALGDLPDGLLALEVPLFNDNLIDRADGATPTAVLIPEYSNWTDEDGVVIKWGTDTPRTSVSAHRPFPLLINIPWPHLKANYDFAAGGVQDVEVDYQIFRGDYPIPSGQPLTVKVDLAIPGPENPDPGPINPALGLVKFKSFSGSETELTTNDIGEPATGFIVLPQILLDTLVAGDELKLYWNNEAVSSPPYIITGSETADQEVPIDIPWTDIEKIPVMDDLPMHYTLTRGNFNNPQESERTLIDVVVEIIDLPEPTFPGQNGNYPINCNSLVEDSDSGVWGIQVHIPPSKYLVQGITVSAEWQTYGVDGTTPLPDTELSAQLPVNEEQEQNGIYWFIPYEKHLKPTYDTGDQYGFGQVRYSVVIRGDNVSSDLETIMVAVFEGAGQHCTIPRP